MTGGRNRVDALALLTPQEARGFVQRIAEALGFSIGAGRSGEGCFILEGARGAGSRAEKAVFAGVTEWPADLPDLDGRRGVLFDLSGAGARRKPWETVGPEDAVKMADSLGVRIPEPEEAPRERAGSDAKFLPSLCKLESDMRWGTDFLSEGKHREAIEYFDKVLRAKPGYSEALRLKAEALSATGDLDGAERALRKAIDSSPEDSALWLALASVFSRRGKKREEMACHEKALDLKPEGGEVWLGRGRAMASRGKLDEAALCFIKSDKLSGGSATALSGLGSALADKGDADGAEEAYRKALELDPRGREARFGLISLLIDNGKHREAVEEADRLTAILPDDKEAWKLRTKALAAEEKASELQRAIILGTKAGKLKPQADEKRDEGKGQKAEPKPASRGKAVQEAPEPPKEPAPSDIDYYWLKMKGGKAPEAGGDDKHEDEGAKPEKIPVKTPVARESRKAQEPSARLASKETGAPKSAKGGEANPVPKEAKGEGALSVPPKGKGAVSVPVSIVPVTDGAGAISAPTQKGAKAEGGSVVSVPLDKGVKTEGVGARPDPSPKGADAKRTEEAETPPALAKAKSGEQGLLDELLRAELGAAKGRKQAVKEMAALKIEPAEAVQELSGDAKLAKLKDDYLCFGDYDKDDPDCKECEAENECVQFSEDADESDEYICFGEFSNREDDCKDCPVKDKCKVRGGGD